MCIAYEKNIGGCGRLPVVVGILKEFTDGIRVQDPVVEFVINILDINNFGTQPLLAAKVGKWLNIVDEVVVCNDDVVRPVMEIA